ncbi:hypothetical protein PTI98_009110 [Pleurotus ostreatus]|nr:hypothetical protein PTI98_009110 [Pleurotus ostreatus]
MRSEHVGNFLDFSNSLPAAIVQQFYCLVRQWEAGLAVTNPYEAKVEAISIKKIRLELAEEEASMIRRDEDLGIHDTVGPTIFKAYDFKTHSISQPGALVMAIQAVKRALFYHRSGVKEPNPRDTLSHLSQSNWADHVETTTDSYGNTITKAFQIHLRSSSLSSSSRRNDGRRWLEQYFSAYNGVNGQFTLETLEKEADKLITDLNAVFPHQLPQNVDPGFILSFYSYPMGHAYA